MICSKSTSVIQCISDTMELMMRKWHMDSRDLEKDESQSLEIVVAILASGNYNNQATISNVNEEDSNEDNDEI